MPKGIFPVDKRIIINEIFLSGIVWWIYIDNINLTCVSIGKLRQSGKIVALDNEVVGSVWVIGDDRVDFIVVALDEDREVFSKTFLDVFGLFLPYKPVLLMSSYEFKQRGFFLVVQTIKCLYLSRKFCLVHGTSGCFEAA